MTRKLTPGRKVRHPKEVAAQLDNLEYYTDPDAHGATQYHYLTPFAKLVKLVATDRVKTMCDRLDCYWMMDLVAGLKQRLCDTFYVVYIVKNEDSSFYFMIDDGNDNILYCKRYPFTDIKKNLKMYLCPNKDLWVLMLPSEY